MGYRYKIGDYKILEVVDNKKGIELIIDPNDDVSRYLICTNGDGEFL